MNPAPSTVIHIGYHRTASTWLQVEVFGKHPEVELVDRGEAQRRLLTVPPLWFDHDAARQWLEGERRRAELHGRVCVLSDEEFSGNIHTGGNGGFLAPAIADRIASVAPDARIVAFVRWQPEMIESAYRQYVAKGGTRLLDDYVARTGAPHRFPGFRLEHLEYDRLLGLYRELGMDLRVFLYEELREEPAAFLARFLTELGLSASPQTLAIADLRTNVGPQGSLTLHRVANRFADADRITDRVIADVPALKKFLMRLVRRTERTPRSHSSCALSAARRRELVEHFAASNRRLGAAFDLPLERFGYLN